MEAGYGIGMGKVAKDLRSPSAQSSEAGRHPALGLRVREVLGAASLAGARVLAGASGLDRVVQRLNVMEVPDGVGFDDVLNEVLSDMLNRQAAVLARSEAVHRALVSVVLDGGGLDDLAVELARILSGPVLVTTPDGEVIAEAGDAGELARVRQAGCFDPTGRFRVESAASGHSEAETAVKRPEPGGNSRPRSETAVVPIVAGRVDHGRIVAFS